MDHILQQRYRAETRRLVARRGRLGAVLFTAGVGIAAILEYYYHPERRFYLLLFFGIELAICLVADACSRNARLRRFRVGLTRSACMALVLCLTLYSLSTGLDRTGLAFLLIVFGLTTALVFPWGTRNQAAMALACLCCEGVATTFAPLASASTLPIAYEVYAVAAAGLVSVVGAAFLDRQRVTVFVQREQLDQHLASFRDLTQSFHGFDPQRVVSLLVTSTLHTFGLTRLWVVWHALGSSGTEGYVVHSGQGKLVWEPVADARPFWTWIAHWPAPAEAFLASSTDPQVPPLLGRARATSLLCMPLGEEGERLGAICADRNGAPLELGDRELALATVLATGATVALANTWLFHRVTMASEEKSIFLARIAHELRNPLQAMLWDLDAVQGGAASPRSELERVRQNALMTLDLAKELQEFAEVETKRLTVNPIPITLDQTFDNLRATALALLDGRPITFQAHVAEGAQVIVTDPFRLRQILINLLSNAAKFTARGTIELEASRAGSEIVISVRDSGVGIDAADLPRIFAPFYRGHAQALTLVRGMGLGLAIAQEIATLLGGCLEVDSAVGRGSTFRLRLPVDARARADQTQGEPGLPGTVILIIEDDDDCRARAVDALRFSGARVIEAGNGFEGLTKAREQHPDVIVLDLGLPGLSGMDVLVQLRRDRQLAAVPVAITTADPEPEARCREIGCNAYMRKPYAPDALVAVIASLVRRAAPEREHTG